jgi:gliding motility-associated-like protein
MNRIALIIGLLLGCITSARADHITGGEVYYKFVGINGGGLYDYDVTVRIFMRCNSGRQFQNPTTFSLFHKGSGDRYKDYDVFLDHIQTISETSDDPCIINPPTVCYQVGYYQFRISLPGSAAYIIATQVMFRIDGISNLTTNYDQVGATYIGEFPNMQNESAHFTGSDLVTICANNPFTYDFGAEDADGDELRYSFCNALRTTGSGGFNGRNQPPPKPPYESVPYGQGFTGSSPLGGEVTINAQTGLVSGVAPAAGKYVVTVCVEELRDGKVIATQHKDLQINITTCSITGATLPPEYMLCGTSTTLNPKNLSTSPLISTFSWQFFDLSGNTLFSSASPEPSYIFTDTGLYQVKLTINSDQACADSATSLVRVYPGFAPDFTISGPCIVRATQFNDATISALGTVTSWSWVFGETTSGSDLSSDRNPIFQYSTTGDKTVTLVAEDSKGCIDTVSKVVNIFDKPPINLAYRDTLICPPDRLQLAASGNGTYNWSPGAEVSDPLVASPFVSPASTTTYYVELDDDGCRNRDSVTVRVVDHVSLQLGNDFKSCEGDTVHINSATDALKFSWTPSATLDDAGAKNVVATPVGSTTYQVTAFISTCSATQSITVTPIPYPVVNAGPDTLICYNTMAQLHATSDGSSFSWAPLANLQAGSTLDPSAVLKQSITYVLYAYDTKGCDKPGIDSVTVNVHPEIIAFAGNDTSIVINQPLHLHASGGEIYEWIPATGLSTTNTSDPIAVYSATPAEGYYVYKVRVSNETGCMDSAMVRVNIYSTLPEIYVPTAFTPNGDGRNDYFKVVAPGIERIKLFRVYNRWGQLVYDSPVTHLTGWDGSYNGKPLPSDTFVWMVQAVDYTGAVHFKKGTVTLIR